MLRIGRIRSATSPRAPSRNMASPRKTCAWPPHRASGATISDSTGARHSVVRLTPRSSRAHPVKATAPEIGLVPTTGVSRYPKGPDGPAAVKLAVFCVGAAGAVTLCVCPPPSDHEPNRKACPPNCGDGALIDWLEPAITVRVNGAARGRPNRQLQTGGTRLERDCTV